MPSRGSCACGAIEVRSASTRRLTAKIEYDGPIDEGAVQCSCDSCRKTTSAASFNVVGKVDKLRVVKGDPKVTCTRP